MLNNSTYGPEIGGNFASVFGVELIIPSDLAIYLVYGLLPRPWPQADDAHAIEW